MENMPAVIEQWLNCSDRTSRSVYDHGMNKKVSPLLKRERERCFNFSLMKSSLIEM